MQTASKTVASALNTKLEQAQNILHNAFSKQDQEKQKLFSDLLNEFKEKELMFEFLANAKKHLNSPKPSVGFFVREDNGVIEITRLCFIIGISMSMVPMESIDYKLFFNTFIDLEGKKIIVKDPVVKKV